MSTIDVGNAAETTATHELTRLGYLILERNWRTKWCEVDIIAQKEEVIWFIEVKYRATNAFGDGLEYIGHNKIMHMQRAAALWTQKKKYAGEYTLGALAVTGEGTVSEILEII